MIHVLDAGPMIAYMDGERGAPVVAQILTDNPNACYAHVFNLTEIYYIYFRRGGVTMAETAIQTLLAAGVIPRDDADEAFWKETGTFKGSHAMSLPDAFCLALARRLGGTVITTVPTDHGEFDPLVQHNYCPTLFIR